MPEELLKAGEIATLVKATPDTIRSWTRSGIIPSVRINSRVIRYRASQVLQALESHAVSNGGER